MKKMWYLNGVIITYFIAEIDLLSNQKKKLFITISSLLISQFRSDCRISAFSRIIICKI